MTRGLVIGKFMPPHKGHQYLIDFAHAYSDLVTIYIGTTSRDPIDPMLRLGWMEALYPDTRIVWRHNDTIPQHPHEHPDFQQIWIDEIQSTVLGRPYDYVFASETYGQWVAKGIGAQFVPVDLDRTAVPISATEIRNNPFDHWSKIPDVVRPYFVKRICVFGPESTGKSVLANQLADYMDTVAVPEYGRTYTELFGATHIGTTDMQNIMKGHIASTKALMSQANKYLICDTDPILSTVWSDLLTGSHEPIFDQYNDPCDLYLLTDIDLPWVDDGTRYFKEQSQRQDFFNRCKAELDRRKLPYRVVSGQGTNRLSCALDHINEWVRTL